MRIRVEREPPAQDVPDHNRPACPAITPRPHRGLVGRLTTSCQVKPFTQADMADQRLLHWGQLPVGHLQVPYGELAPVEQSLVCHVRLGERLDLAAGGEATDEAAMRSWGDGRTCRAVVIRDILCGRLALDPDPHGLRLRGA